MTKRATSAQPPAPGGIRNANARNPRLLWRLAFGVAVVVQLIVLYAPDAFDGPEINGLDKVVHLAIFLAPTLAALMLGLPPRWALGILALHAPVSELIQHLLLPNREGDVLDVMADLGGVLLGGLAYLVRVRRQH